MFWTILLGIATGMRTMTGIAVVCWAAYLGYLPVQGTWAFWTAKLVSVIVFTLCALGEYIGDTLPQTPNRTAALPLLARMCFGTLVGSIIAAALRQPLAGGIILGVIGALIGAYGGLYARRMTARAFGRDLPAAITGTILAIGLAIVALHGLQSDVRVLLEHSRF